MNKCFILFSWLACCCFSKSYAQKEDNIWAFGFNAALDLNSGTPEFISGYQTFIIEGTAAISDPEGNILLYSDGLKIWNRLHHVMPGGSGLHGNLNGWSCQGTAISKYPGSDSLYYVFTLNPSGTPDPELLSYTLVDMSLDDGLGGVITTKKM